MYIRRAGTEHRVLLPDEIRDINNRRIDIVPNVATSPVIDNKRSEYKPYIEPTPSPKSEVKESIISKRLPFIEANTKEVSVGHLKNDCIIPVFSKDNEVTISHHSFIEAVYDAANEVFRGERVDNPDVRVSHIIKGRIPEAMDKPVNQLLETDRTIYYERMMFCIEIPTIYEDIAGNRLNLTVGGVRAYNQENLWHTIRRICTAGRHLRNSRYS